MFTEGPNVVCECGTALSVLESAVVDCPDCGSMWVAGSGQGVDNHPYPVLMVRGPGGITASVMVDLATLLSDVMLDIWYAQGWDILDNDPREHVLHLIDGMLAMGISDASRTSAIRPVVYLVIRAMIEGGGAAYINGEGVIGGV